MRPFNTRVFVVAVIAAVTLALLTASLLAGRQLVAAVHRRVGPPPADRDCEMVRFTSLSGATLVAWLCRPARRPRAAVVVLA